MHGITAQEWTRPHKQKLAVCMVVGTLLWFCDWTDYSLAGTWADLLLPMLGVIAGGVGLRLSRGVPGPRLRIAARIAAILTLVEAAIVVAFGALITAIAPFGIMLVFYSIVGEEQVSATVSPDGSRVAEQYYSSGGLLSDGWTVVRVKHRLFPLLERDVYRTGMGTSERIVWEDNDTLYISATGDRVHVGAIRPEVAPPAQLGMVAIRLIGVMAQVNRDMAERRRRDEEMSRPLKTIPIYPGGTENDNTGADMLTEGGYRAFDIKAPNSDEAAKWYKSTLSQGEWRVVGTKRRVTSAETITSDGEQRLVYNCIDSVRREPNGTEKHYYWRFLWGEQFGHVRVIVNTPERPAWSDCDEPNY
jgi:hypothetical protein